MARGDYFICPVCDEKALYDHDPYGVGPAEVEVLHKGCLEKVRAVRDLSWLSETHWSALKTSAHLWGWAALDPKEKAPSGAAARISPSASDRIVDAALWKVRGMLEGWSEGGRYHHCSSCGERGPLRHEGDTYTCAKCNEPGIAALPVR